MITNFFIKVNLSNLRIENFIFSKNNKNYFESSDVEVYTNSKVILDKNNIKNDAQIIANLYTENKHRLNDGLIGINGAYSFLLIDKKEKKVIVGCDEFHHRPMYYAKKSDSFFFFTDVKYILDFDENFKTLDKEIFFDYLNSGIPREGKTVYKFISVVPNGKIIEMKFNKKQLIKKIPLKINDPNKNNISYGLKQRLYKTIKSELDKFSLPVAITSSGGLDSSAIVGIARNCLPERQIQTHSFIYKDLSSSQSEAADEKIHMDNVNKMNNADPYYHEFNKKDGPISILDETTKLAEPLIGPNIFTHLKVFKHLKKQNINVLFEGRGGDEIISHGRLVFLELGKKFRIIKLLKEYKNFL